MTPTTFFREQKRYTQSELMKMLEISSEEEMVDIIRKLKEFGILKAVKASDIQKDLSDLESEDIELTDVEVGDHEHFYVFTYVGVITILGHVLICCPKYLSKSNPKKEMRQIIRVLEKYNNSKEQIIHMFNDSSEGKSFNLIAVLLFLIQDYQENGSYSNTEEIIEYNGSGEILWEKTINESFALISHNRPIYPILQTKKRISNDFDYFKRLHECVVTKASCELENLLDLFGIDPINLSDEELDDFGDREYILYRIQNELSLQFNTRKQLVMKTLYAYYAQDKHIFDVDCFSMIGTNTFNLVWEEVCKSILNNQLEMQLRDLDLPLPLNGTKYPDDRIRLLDVIDKPFWSITGESADKTLIPDLITINKPQKQFIIFDAKYYCPDLVPGKPPKGQPGIESITKQYLYQMAYQEFITLHGFTSVINCFLIPTSNPQEDVFKGHVEMMFLRNSVFKLENIQVRLLPTQDAFEKYLNGEMYSLDSLKLNTSIPSVRTTAYSDSAMPLLKVAEEPAKYETH